MAQRVEPAQDHQVSRHGRGPSSFWMHDPEVVFAQLALHQGDRILDLGCGPGDYALRAAKLVGSAGSVHAVDIWPYLIDWLREEAERQQLHNIYPLTADMTVPLPLASGSFDRCFLFTVLHSFNLPQVETTLFPEICRLLRPGGRVAVIECKKEDQPFGPPRSARLSPQQVAQMMQPFGFRCRQLTDLGYTYLQQFAVSGCS